MLRLSIGSCMLRLRLSIGSAMVRLRPRFSFRGSGEVSMHESMLSLSLSMHEPMLSLSMLVLDPNHPD